MLIPIPGPYVETRNRLIMDYIFTLMGQSRIRRGGPTTDLPRWGKSQTCPLSKRQCASFKNVGFETRPYGFGTFAERE